MNSALERTATIGVVGAGTMGLGIAEVAAAAGHPVRLYDNRDGAAVQALASLAARLLKRVERGRLTATERDALLARIAPAANLEALAPAALVVEAVAESLDVKRQVFTALEGIVGDDAILASNTSSLSITAIGAVLRHPGRLVGMHFFNPVPVMALVEVVRGLDSETGIVERVAATATAWGKRPVTVASTPGFIVNRVARPFYGEALRLLQEGATDAATLDTLMREAGGFRMGPCELMDLIGHDINLAVSRSVWAAFFNDPRYRPSLLQREMVGGGRLGRKSGRGFYDYSDGATRPAAATLAAAPVPARVVQRGDLGPIAPLAARLVEHGVTIDRGAGIAGGEGWLEADGVHIALSDGRTATERAAAEGGSWVLLDLALDFATTPRLAVATADGAGAEAQGCVAGLLQAAGIAVSKVDDTPGLVLLRTVCLLANEGAEAVLQRVCSAAAVDEAMVYGVNYPRGPLAWGDALGAQRVVTVLDHIQAAYGEERYRASLLLRRCAASGRALLDAG